METCPAQYPIRLKPALNRQSNTRLGRAWYLLNSPRAEHPKLRSYPGEYFRPSPIRPLQPSHRYQHSLTSPDLHGFLGLLVHRINVSYLILSYQVLFWSSNIFCSVSMTHMSAYLVEQHSLYLLNQTDFDWNYCYVRWGGSRWRVGQCPLGRHTRVILAVGRVRSRRFNDFRSGRLQYAPFVIDHIKSHFPLLYRGYPPHSNLSSHWQYTLINALVR